MTTTVTPPADFTFVIPDDWARIRLREEASRRADIDRIVRDTTRHRSDRDSLGPELRVMLDNACHSATVDPHAEEIYLSFTTLREHPVAASLMVYVRPPEGRARTSHEIAMTFLAAFAGAQTDVWEMDDTLVAKVVRGVEAEIDPEHRADTVVAHYAYPVPMVGGYVLLSFSTPLLEVAEPMIAVFDAIAQSFRWVW